VYPKTLDDFREQTTSGAIVSIITTLFVFWLFFSELSLYLRSDMDPQLFVDTERSDKIRV
jgi:endoplasmic reticulum-Golgi intermediate compartment protein 3